MKIFAYGIRDDELSSLRKWEAAHPDVEVGYTGDTLTPDTAKLAKGSNGVVTLQTTPYEREAWKSCQNTASNPFLFVT